MCIVQKLQKTKYIYFKKNNLKPQKDLWIHKEKGYGSSTR